MIETKMSPLSLSVVIPTYNRGELLLETLQQLLDQLEKADEILVVDQTEYAEGDQVKIELQALDASGHIRWLRRVEPSIPKAMNVGLLYASSDWVLFIDDDVRFSNDFIKRHKCVVNESTCLAHVGQIVQPWQRANDARVMVSHDALTMQTDLDFAFNSSKPSLINNCMAGNLCVNRLAAIEAGGFDENFFGVAYRFETEFCKRFCKVHKSLFYYSPSPLLDHLHVKSGGTRAHADFLSSTSATHSMGDYYFAMLLGHNLQGLGYICRRFLGCIISRFYIKKPWFIPFRIVGETRGLLAALSAFKVGQKLIPKQDKS